MIKKAVFFDRDGTLIPDSHYLNNVEGVVLMPGVAEALQDLQKDFLLIVISNQSGVGRGYFTCEVVHAQNGKLKHLFEAEKVHLSGVYFCPHVSEDSCECRKPRPGMLYKAALDLGIDLNHSYVVGDKDSDINAGKAAGCRTVLLSSEPCHDADFTTQNMRDVANWILFDVGDHSVACQKSSAKKRNSIEPLSSE